MKIEIELPERKGFEYTGEFRRPEAGEWGYCHIQDTVFEALCLNIGDYRPCHILKEIKPKELTLEEKVKAKYPDYEVLMLIDDRDILMFPRFGDEFKHVEAQSIKGFHGYVYHREWDNNYYFRYYAADVLNSGKYIQPIAVLFNKDCN
jgi:hypothetical protein